MNKIISIKKAERMIMYNVPIGNKLYAKYKHYVDEMGEAFNNYKVVRDIYNNYYIELVCKNCGKKEEMRLCKITDNEELDVEKLLNKLNNYVNNYVCWSCRDNLNKNGRQIKNFLKENLEIPDDIYEYIKITDNGDIIIPRGAVLKNGVKL